MSYAINPAVSAVHPPPITEVLGWLVSRTEGKRLDAVLSERIWAPLGMEQDADFLIDSTGMPFAGGGLNPCLRDMARFGEAAAVELFAIADDLHALRSALPLPGFE